MSQMTQALTYIADKIDSLNRLIGHSVSYFTLFMVLAMFLNVVLRYAFNLNLIWQQELVGFMHSIVFLAAAGYTLLDEKHVRVDIFYQQSSNKTKAYIDLVGVLIFLLPVSISIAYLSYDFIINSWSIEESSPEYNGMAGVFLLKTCIWLFSGTLFLQGISTICKSLTTVRSA